MGWWQLLAGWPSNKATALCWGSRRTGWDGASNSQVCVTCGLAPNGCAHLQVNQMATRLTMRLHEGLKVEVSVPGPGPSSWVARHTLPPRWPHPSRPALPAPRPSPHQPAALLACSNVVRNQIRGDALAFYAQPGSDFGEVEWQQARLAAAMACCCCYRRCRCCRCFCSRDVLRMLHGSAGQH